MKEPGGLGLKKPGLIETSAGRPWLERAGRPWLEKAGPDRDECWEALAWKSRAALLLATEAAAPGRKLDFIDSMDRADGELCRKRLVDSLQGPDRLKSHILRVMPHKFSTSDVRHKVRNVHPFKGVTKAQDIQDACEDLRKIGLLSHDGGAGAEAAAVEDEGAADAVAKAKAVKRKGCAGPKTYIFHKRSLTDLHADAGAEAERKRLRVAVAIFE